MDNDLTPEEQKLLEEHRKGIKQSLVDVQVTDMLETGLTIDGAHHKQYALWRIAEILNLTHFFKDIEDHGIAP